MVSLDARSKNGMKSITEIIMEACKEKMERDRKRGIKNRPIRAMVVGIRMSENPHLSIRMREKRVQRPETSRV